MDSDIVTRRGLSFYSFSLTAVASILTAVGGWASSRHCKRGFNRAVFKLERFQKPAAVFPLRLLLFMLAVFYYASISTHHDQNIVPKVVSRLRFPFAEEPLQGMFPGSRLMERWNHFSGCHVPSIPHGH